MTAIAIAATFLVFRESGQGPALDQGRTLGSAADGARVAGGWLPLPGQVASSPVAPGVFAPGACVAFAPAEGKAGHTVFLDASHGGTDPGGSGHTPGGQRVTEADVNLVIERDTLALLTAKGYRVVVSRTGQGAMTSGVSRAEIQARDVCANMAHAELLVGICMKAGRGGRGPAAGYDPDRPFAASNRRLAALLRRDVARELNSRGYGVPDGAVSSDRALGHPLLLGPVRPGQHGTPSRMPGALIEPLLLTDPSQASLAANARAQSLIATGITRAVCEFFTSPGRR